jgi:sugar lactone lactonase YvrE
LRLAHDAKGLSWVAATAADGGTRLHSFDRDGGLRFVIDTPPGTTVVDEDGEYLLTLGADGVLRVMEVVNDGPKAGNQVLTSL